MLSDILQPQWERDLRWGSVRIGWSFACEPGSSEARVSQAIYVLLLKWYTLRLHPSLEGGLAHWYLATP